MQIAAVKYSPSLSDNIVQAALAWHKLPSGRTRRALREAVDALVHQRSRAVADFLAKKQKVPETPEGRTGASTASAEFRNGDAGKFALFCDGSTIRNPGPSGCGWVVVSEEAVVCEGFKAIGYATNQIAEIRAAAYGLDDLPKGSTVDVHTDSLYVVKTMRGQFRKGMNLEHWDVLSDAVNRHRLVNFHHLRGYAGHQLNELADSLAKKGSTLSQRNSKSLVNRSASRAVTGGANQF
ncbi:ribonuclease HI [Caballeronia sp. J97]|uniref:ribonuclease HI n=1 Tax=Caballeronia sp. J97 TaxID=2805429 RepID=UPI002AAFFCFC|nr:RNase H family protein [Caballeronia sp. J97]